MMNASFDGWLDSIFSSSDEPTMAQEVYFCTWQKIHLMRKMILWRDLCWICFQDFLILTYLRKPRGLLASVVAANRSTGLNGVAGF